MDFDPFLFLFATALALAYFYVKNKYSYWANLGVPFAKPSFPRGNLSGVFFSTSLHQRVNAFYDQFKGKFVLGGIYFFLNPVAIICDLDFLKNVLVKDFHHFQDRSLFYNEKAEPLSAHLFAVEGEKWQNLRHKLTPTFTTGRIKMMHSTFLRVADEFKRHLQPLADRKQEVEIKDLLARFTTDIIGNVAFGVDCDSIKDPESVFRKTGQKVLEASKWQMFLFSLIECYPNVVRKLNLAFMDPSVSEFFMKLVRDTVEYREQNDIQRDDLMSLLLQIKNKGKLDGEDEELGKLTLEEVAAQVFLFFLAGHETASTSMALLRK